MQQKALTRSQIREAKDKLSDLIVSYHEHDSLLENKQEEVLSEEERKKAWEEYNAPPAPPQPFTQLQYNAMMAEMMAQKGLGWVKNGNPNQNVNFQAMLQNLQMAHAQQNAVVRANYIMQQEQKRRNLMAGNQMKSMGTRFPNPFASEIQVIEPVDPLALHPSLDNLSPSELCTVGQNYRLMPKEGESINDFRNRLGTYIHNLSSE